MSRFHPGLGVLLTVVAATAYFLSRLLRESKGVAVAEEKKPGATTPKNDDGDFSNIAKILVAPSPTSAVLVPSTGTTR